MTTEQLMQDRVQVAMDYPNCPYKVGDILWQIPDTANWYGHYGCNILQTALIRGEIVAQYPHIFKKLDWWDRGLNDLPKYVKYKKGYGNGWNGIYKVIKWHTNCFGEGSSHIINHIHIDCKNMLPATEQEYNDYINRPK